MLSQDEWITYDLVGLAELEMTGDVSREEILRTAIHEIERLNPTLNCVIMPQFEQALDSLQQAPEVQRFTGLPYLIKDLHTPVKGLPLSNGSVRFNGTTFDFDSTTVSRLRRAGLSILGRSTSSEFGLSAATESVAWGLTRNPWNTDHSAGGSSGGAGSAVASGMLPAAHATDSAGSIRIPATFNGLVGFKPTRALNAFGPHRGDPNYGMSHEHAVTRSVRDCAALLDITAGPDAGCPYFTAKPDVPFEILIQTPPGQLTIGMVTTTFDGIPVHDESKLAVERTARCLEELGHRVTEDMPTFDNQLLTSTMIRVLMGSLAGLFAGVPTDNPSALDGLQPITQEAVRFSQTTSLRDHLQRATVINQQVRSLATYWNNFDLLLCPTANGPAPKHGILPMDHRDLNQFLDNLFTIAPFTAPFNASGQPAISLPMHQTADGLPVGVQFVGKFGEDARLLQLAAQLEAVNQWQTCQSPRIT